MLWKSELAQESIGDAQVLPTARLTVFSVLMNTCVSSNFYHILDWNM